MKKHLSIVAISVILMSWPIKILAAPANQIVISEIQTASASDASQEFVELYNPTSASISVDNWTMEYASSSGTTWTKKATLSGAVPAFGFFLISTSGYMAGDVVMSSGLAGAGGHLRIKNSSGTVIDLVGWGTAAHPEGAAIEAPIAGGSVERIPGRLNSSAGNGEDTNTNSLDFVLRDMAEPQRISSAVEDPSLALPPTPDPDPGETDPIPVTTYLPVYITEALPDPASPLTDAKDEYIELFNPNDVAVSLKGYTIRTGSNFRSYYTIGEVSIAPGAYMSFYSVDTKLGLPNSGGAVQILDPLGNILDVTDTYGTTKVGQAWADINGVWVWTLEPTPGAANVLSEPAPKTITTTTKATAKKVAAKKTTTKKASTKKAAAKKTSKAKSKKVAKPKIALASATQAITDPSPVARWLLIAAGCFTIMYALYGFRHDIYNYYIKTQRNIAARFSNRSTLPWRRNRRAN